MNGYSAWHRVPTDGAWSRHVHSIATTDRTASAAAKRWVRRFLRGR